MALVKVLIISGNQCLLPSMIMTDGLNDKTDGFFREVKLPAIHSTLELICITNMCSLFLIPTLTDNVLWYMRKSLKTLTGLLWKLKLCSICSVLGQHTYVRTSIWFHQTSIRYMQWMRPLMALLGKLKVFGIHCVVLGLMWFKILRSVHLS